MSPELLQPLRFDSDGLIPAIAQDAESGRVLMVAWMNAESLELTLREGYAVYWSRSRQQLWRKGESSGHRQRVRELRVDCDGDVLLLQIDQSGSIACHTGREACFYRVWRDGAWHTVDPVLRDPEEIYR